MKSKTQKKQEAIQRLKASTYKNSKAFRTGKSEIQWQTQKENHLTKLS